MSHQILHRVTARMLWDDQFARQVFEAPDQALAGLDLDDEERAALATLDPRALRVDPLRRRRTLQALCAELPVSVALTLSELGRISSLDAYFQSAPFHRAMMARGSMFLAFTEYLRSLNLRCPQLPDVLRVEEALGVCRRELERPCPRISAAPVPTHVWTARAPGVGVLTVDGETLTWMNAVQQTLFELSLIPAMGLVSDGPRVPPLSPPGEQAPKLLVVHPAAGGSGLLELGRVVHTFLGQLDSPTLATDALNQACRLGLSEAKAESLIFDLHEEGLIIAEAP
ncbi:MAG: hypothetical protein RIT28_3917 [Pseudomonadota bacterium]